MSTTGCSLFKFALENFTVVSKKIYEAFGMAVKL